MMLHCFLCVFIPILFAVRSGFKGILRRRRFGNLRLMVNEKRSFTLKESGIGFAGCEKGRG